MNLYGKVCDTNTCRGINAPMTPRILYFTVFLLVWIACWLLVAGVSFETRPLVSSWAMPLVTGDEQRILSIVWHMWRESSFLTPWSDEVQTDAAYPMLFWIISLGWALFDVSDWWPHVVGYVSGLACVFLTAGFARILWPGWAGLGAMSGTALSAMAVWLAYSGFLGPVMVAAVFVITAMYALVWAWRTGRWDGFLYFGLATGACVLTIGPFAWIVCVPAALLTPVWGGALAEQIDDDRSPPQGWRRWYVHVLAGSVLSIAIVAGWLGWVFAAEQATVEFLLVQYWAPMESLVSGERVSTQPWWQLLIIFNCMAVPWVFWSPAWRSLSAVGQLVSDGGARLALIWIASVFLPVVIVPGFGASDLLLALPAVGLVIAFLVFCRADKEAGELSETRSGESAIGLILVLLGAVVIVAPYSGVAFQTSWWISHLAGGWGVLLIVLGVVAAYAMPRLVDLRMMTISVIASLVMVVAYLVAEPLNRDYFSAWPAATYVSEQLTGGSVVAFAGPYAGEFDFTARLTEDLPVLALDDPIGIAAWIAGNPGAIVAQVVDELPTGTVPEAQALEHFAFGTRYMVFWSGEAIAANPALLTRPVP